MIKILYKKLFIPKYLLKKSKSSINSIKIYYKYLRITPFLIWKLVELYVGNKFITIYINRKKIGYKIKDFIFSYNKKISFEKYI